MQTIILSILLQVPPPTIIERVGDQILSIGLLLTIAWILWQRITKVQDRMDNYLNEDRKEMSKVIENNTKVMNDVLDILKDAENKWKA